MEILKVCDLEKKYESDNSFYALNKISFSVEKGEFVAIVGPSGSGKSTLLHIIGGVDSPTGGKVYVNGIDVHRQTSKELSVYRRRQVSLIYQFYNLFPTLNVIDNIKLPLELDNKKADDKKIDELMKRLGIIEKSFYYPKQLSGGQQQRVAIARALAVSPAILLADEPTGNLDSKNTAEIMDLFCESNKEFDQTLIIVTHEEYVAQRADRVIRIEDGKIVGDTK